MIKQFDKYWNLISSSNLNLTQKFKELYVKMVAYKPIERPTINEILSDAWMQEINNLNNEELNALENELRNELHNREAQIIQNQLGLEEVESDESI